MRASPEIGAVFADPELLGVGDAFGRCQDMNLDFQLFLRRDGRKTAIVVGGGEGEPWDAPGERKGLVKTAGASAQGSLRGQRDEGSAALMQRGSGRRRLESQLPGAAIVLERETGAMEQRGLRGSVELVRGGREVTHGGVADRVLVVVAEGARRFVVEGLLKRLDGEAVQGFEQQADGSGSADGSAGAAQLVAEENRVETSGGGQDRAIQGPQPLRVGAVAGKRKIAE